VLCASGSPGQCLAIGCSTYRDCAPGTACMRAGSLMICYGCAQDADCAPGQRCADSLGSATAPGFPVGRCQ
jgi:hypothetical protein